MNNYLTSVIFLIFIGIIFFTYQNGHINKSVFVLSLFLFVLILPLFYYGTKRQVENFRSFASLDQLSNASLDAYYTNASSKDREVLSCNEKERNRRPPITGVYQDISYFKNDYPQITINKNTGVTIGLESISLNSDSPDQENYNLKIRTNKNGTPMGITAETSGLVNNLYMSILSSIELGQLQQKLEKSDNIPMLMNEYKNKLQNQLTFKFGSSGQDVLPETQISNLIDGTWNADLSEEEQLILPGDHLVFAGNLGLLGTISQIAQDQQPTPSMRIIVYKVDFENQNSQAYKYTKVASSDSETLSKQDGSNVVTLKNTRTGFLTIKNKNYPRLPYKDNEALKLEAPYLFRTWALISGDNKHLSFSSFNSESHVFLTEKDNFNKPIYAKSPNKGTNRSVIRLNDKLPQQWTIGLFTNSQNPNVLCFIHTYPDGLYYLGVDGDKVAASPFGKQTKQLWKITKVDENGVAKYKIQSAYNAKYLAYSANGGYLYGNRGNVYLMNVEEEFAPLWDITFSLAGENAGVVTEANMPTEGFVGNTIVEHQTNQQDIAQIQFGAPNDTPISSGAKGAWQPLYTTYWNGKYIYCFTNKGVQSNDNLDNYLEINLNDNGEGIVSVQPDNMQLQDSSVDISADDRQRYGGDYRMKAISSNIIWGNKTDVDGVGLYLEMLPNVINRQNLIQQMLMQPNKIRIKAMIIDGKKKMSLCGVTWNQRDRLESYCSKVILENFEQVNPSSSLATGAQNTGSAAGNLPIKVDEEGHYLGYPKIKQGPAAIGASDYTDPQLSACMVGPGKKIAIPGWYQDSGDKRLAQVSGTCVSINPSFSAIDRSDASALSTSVSDAKRGTKGQCSGPNYLSGAITGAPVTYKDIPGRTQIFSGQTANNIINWKGACLPQMMTGPGVYQAFNKINMIPATGYGYWKKGNQMVSTYRINQYDTNPIYIDQNENRRNENSYLNSPQTYAYAVANLRPVKEPWRYFWTWNNNANVVCQETENMNEAFAQKFMTDGTKKYYKFFHIPPTPYGQNIQQCKAKYDDASRKVECFRVSDLDPIYSPKQNFWRDNASSVAICELTEYKANSWSADGYKPPTDAFAMTTKSPYCKVKFVIMAGDEDKKAANNEKYARKNLSEFVMPYYFRMGGKDNNYSYPDLPEYLIEIRDFDSRFNGKYFKSNYVQDGKYIWIKKGGNVNTQPAIRYQWRDGGWNICENRSSTCYGSNNRKGYIPSSWYSDYKYNWFYGGDLGKLLATGAPIFTWDYRPYPDGPKVYPADITMENFTSNQQRPCIKHGVSLPGWYEDNRFGQQDQCVAFPRNKYATRCCNTTYRQGTKAGQNVTYTTENGEVNACNVTFNKRYYPNAWSIQNWKNWCLK
jgi:hypothetical protein